MTTTVVRAVPATQVWTDMNLSCAAGDTLEIVVSGTAMHEDSATGEVGPNGLSDPKYHRYNVPGLPDANTVAVIGSLDKVAPLFGGHRDHLLLPAARRALPGRQRRRRREQLRRVQRDDHQDTQRLTYRGSIGDLEPSSVCGAAGELAAMGIDRGVPSSAPAEP